MMSVFQSDIIKFREVLWLKSSLAFMVRGRIIAIRQCRYHVYWWFSSWRRQIIITRLIAQWKFNRSLTSLMMGFNHPYYFSVTKWSSGEITKHLPPAKASRWVVQADIVIWIWLFLLCTSLSYRRCYLFTKVLYSWLCCLLLNMVSPSSWHCI